VLSTVLGSGFLRFFGRYTHSLYVFHFMLRPNFVAWLHPEQIQAWVGSRILGLWVFTALVATISSGIALVSRHAFEKHFSQAQIRLQVQNLRRTI
jgi:hypothetical protein